MRQERLQGSSLFGRRTECEQLDTLVAGAASGRSGVLVLRGEPGVGKTALLGYLSDRVARWQVVRAVGVESEMELAYSGLHQLCAPLLDRLHLLPGPQRDALAIVFGRTTGPPPDRLLVGLGVLTLVSESAEREPLACVVDDGHWLDQASAQILGFVARRLLVERVVLVAAVRSGVGDGVLQGVPELRVRGLRDADARALLLENVYGPIDVAVCDQIVAESHGNPLALLELPRTWSTTELAGGFGLPRGGPVAGKIEQSYARRLFELPHETRLVVLTAAAEPLGDPVLLRRAAARLRLDSDTARPAADAGLLKVGARVEFSHPLVRSAAYRAATAEDRQRVHRALADATDAEADPDRRAWHSARATPEPDEVVATELERSADRAQARGGVAAVAAFLQDAVGLTVDPTRRTARALAAAEASLASGAVDAALRLLATAESGPLNELQQAQATLIRGHAVFAAGRAGEGAELLLRAAVALQPLDLALARDTFVLAWRAATIAGDLAGSDVLNEVCEAVRKLPPLTDEPRPADLLLDGMTLIRTAGRTAATPVLLRAAKAVATMAADDVLRWGSLSAAASGAIWDFDGMQAVAEREAQLAREAGALTGLPLHLSTLGLARAWCGDLAGASAVLEEVETASAVTGQPVAPAIALRLHALQGRQEEATIIIAAAMKEARDRRQGLTAAQAHWAAAVLYNGLGRYREATTSALHASSNTFEPWFSTWALPELVEAASRTGDIDVARDALARLVETTRPAGTDLGLGLEARCRALVGDGEQAEDSYREALQRLERTSVRTEVARAHLVYGEWLRRENRQSDARRELRLAQQLLETIGMEAFAERARRELTATGAKMRSRSVDVSVQLTAQEEQIAGLVRDGMSNAEIGARLFISPRTVEWHLRQVFAKLGIGSRRELAEA
jgi:DNA-binding CsgD family transcriptional regulator